MIYLMHFLFLEALAGAITPQVSFNILPIWFHSPQQIDLDNGQSIMLSNMVYTMHVMIIKDDYCL